MVSLKLIHNWGTIDKDWNFWENHKIWRNWQICAITFKDKTIAFSHLALNLILSIDVNAFPTHGKFEINSQLALTWHGFLSVSLTGFCVEKLMVAIYLPRCTNDIDRVDVEKGKQSINWWPFSSKIEAYYSHGDVAGSEGLKTILNYFALEHSAFKTKHWKVSYLMS